MPNLQTSERKGRDGRLSDVFGLGMFSLVLFEEGNENLVFAGGTRIQSSFHNPWDRPRAAREGGQESRGKQHFPGGCVQE